MAPCRRPVHIERFRDGFSIGGSRILDPEGRIVNFSVDSATGNAAYLVESGPDTHLLKLMRFQSGAPVVIASANRQNGSWNVETVNGLRVNGPRLNLEADGFIVARDNALFRYQAGKGLSTFALPEAYTLAAQQNGDVGGTNWVLLEKRRDTKESEGGIFGHGSLGQLISTVKDLGSTLGVAKGDSDYALYQIERQQVVPLGISLTEKESSFMSQCHQRNRWVAKCDQAETRDALYAQDGSPNRSHYYWRVSWYATARGPIAVLMEDGIGKIQALDLNSGRRAVVFERALGIGDWSTNQTPDGKIEVHAKLGFESAKNLDVGAMFTDAISPGRE